MAAPVRELKRPPALPVQAGPSRKGAVASLGYVPQGAPFGAFSDWMMMVVRTGGLEPPRAKPDGFSYLLRFSPPLGCPSVCGLDYPFTVPRWRGLGAARLVSTPSEALSRQGLARDCQLRGFPEFEQFCIAGFPASTQDWSKSVASTDFATSA
jgi:hypothetical protein